MRFSWLLLFAMACAQGLPSDSCVTNGDCTTDSCVNGMCVPAEDTGLPDAPRDAGAPEPDGDVDASSVPDARQDTTAQDVGVDAAVDAPIDGGADANVRCAPALFCEDFETPPPPGRYDATVTGASVIELSTAQAHSGVQSLLLRATQSDPSVSVGFNAFDDSQVGERWVRAWYFLPNLVGLSPLALESSTSALTVFTGGENYTALDTYMFPGEQQSSVSTLPLRHQVWTCIEVHLDYDGPVGAELYIDGALAAQMNRSLPSALQFLRLGAGYRDPADPSTYDVYLDDIATSFERLGCD